MKCAYYAPTRVGAIILVAALLSGCGAVVLGGLQGAAMGASIHAGKTDNQAPNKKLQIIWGTSNSLGESERIASTKAVERCAQQGGEPHVVESYHSREWPPYPTSPDKRYTLEIRFHCEVDPESSSD